MEIGESIELDEEYLNMARNIKIEKIILGIDPYPNGATKIPFVKKTFEELNKKSSGYKIFSAFYGENLKKKFKNPKEVAYDLLKNHKTLLLNSSYHYVKGNIKKNDKYHKEAYKINQEFFKIGVTIYCCGKHSAKAFNWIYRDNIDKKITMNEVIHPSIRGWSTLEIIKELKKSFTI